MVAGTSPGSRPSCAIFAAWGRRSSGTPFYLTPFLDEGYDVSDHLQVDPRFGKLADIIAFIEQARELGMQVIIELLIQHTSDAHPWFQQARRNPASPYRDYYLWSDNDEDDTPPMCRSLTGWSR